MKEMTRREILKKDESGFTLMEIVAVLILVGILASWAAPKFFDMQTAGEKKAAEAALSDAQVQINTFFSKRLYVGDNCSTAQTKVQEAFDFKKTIEINGFTLSGDTLTTEGVTVKAKKGNDTELASATLKLPDCITDLGTSSDSAVCPSSIVATEPAEPAKTVHECDTSKVIERYGEFTCSCNDNKITCSGSSTDTSGQRALDLSAFNTVYSQVMGVIPMVWENLSERDFQQCTNLGYSCDEWYSFLHIFCKKSTNKYSCSSAEKSIPEGTLIQKNGTYYVAKQAFSVSVTMDKDGKYVWSTMWDNIKNSLILVTGVVIRSKLSEDEEETWKSQKSDGTCDSISSVDLGSMYYSSAESSLYVCSKSGETGVPPSNGWLKVVNYSSQTQSNN